MQHATESTEGRLLVVLRDQPRLLIAERLTDGALNVGGEMFTPVIEGDWIGFYDWLRTRDKRLVGVRQWFDSDSAWIADELKSLNYISVDEAASAGILFMPGTAIAHEHSDSQSFGGNRAYQSQGGVYMLTFALHWLTKRDLSDLVSLGAVTLAPSSTGE